MASEDNAGEVEAERSVVKVGGSLVKTSGGEG